MTLKLAPGVPTTGIHDQYSYMAELNKLRFEKIKRQLAYIFPNQHYGARLREAGVNRPEDVRSFEEFRSLPALMHKAWHREGQTLSLEMHGHPFGLHLCADPKDVVHVAGTSGTTGLPTFYLFTKKDLERTHTIYGRMFAMAGIRPGDRSLHLFGLSLWLAGTTIMQSLEAYGACPIPLGAEAGVRKALQYIKMCRPRVLFGTPSIITYLIERAPEELGQPLNTMGIEIVVAGGEPALAIPNYRKRIQEGTGAAVYDFSGGAWLNSAMACAGPVHTGQHYLAEDYCFRYDLVDPVTKKPLELVDGAEGEAIHTALEYDAAPAFRYASGDILKLHVNECPHCGQFGARFHFVGRADDLMNIAGVKVYPSAIKEVVEMFSPQLTGMMQVVLSEPLPKVTPPLRVDAEASAGLDSSRYEDLARKVEEQLHIKLKVRAQVTVVSNDTLEKSNLKTKLIRYQEAARS